MNDLWKRDDSKVSLGEQRTEGSFELGFWIADLGMIQDSFSDISLFADPDTPSFAFLFLYF